MPFSFPDTELTPDSVVFNCNLDSIHDVSEFGDAVTELCRMLNDRYIASHRDPIDFPRLGVECTAGTLNTIDYNTELNYNPFRDIERLLTKCFRSLQGLLTPGVGDKYLLGVQASAELLRDLDLLETPEWYAGSYSHDPFYNYLDTGYDPEDQFYVSHRLHHQLHNNRQFLTQVPNVYDNFSYTLLFPYYEMWKKIILAMRKALLLISGDRITSNSHYRSVSMIPMIAPYETFLANLAEGSSYVKTNFGLVESDSYNDDETQFRVDKPFNAWPPVWQLQVGTISAIRNQYYSRSIGFESAGLAATFTKGENGEVWVPTNGSTFSGPVPLRWWKQEFYPLLEFRIGIVSDWETVGLEVDVEVPTPTWEFTLRPNVLGGKHRRIKSHTTPSEGGLYGSTIRDFLATELTIRNTIDDSSIPEDSSPLEYIGYSGQVSHTRCAEYGVCTGVPIVEIPGLNINNGSFVFYRESPSNVYQVFPKE